MNDGEIYKSMFQALSDRVDESIQGMARMEGGLARLEGGLARMEGIVSNALEAQKRITDPTADEYMPSVRTQMLMEDSVAGILKITPVILDPKIALQISKTASAVRQMDQKIRSIDAQMAIQLAMETSTPST